MDQSDDFEQTKRTTNKETTVKRVFIRQVKERLTKESSELKKNERFATATDSLPVSYETSTKKLHSRSVRTTQKASTATDEECNECMTEELMI